MGTELIWFVVVVLDFVTILFFFFLFLHPFRHLFGAASQTENFGAQMRAEMADVEQMKIIPFVTFTRLSICLHSGVWGQCI